VPFEESQRYCPSCEQKVLARRKSTNHLLHLALSVLTAGLWIIVWLAASGMKGEWLCTRCGTACDAGREVRLESPRDR
jgi:hypothetical protein